MGTVREVTLDLLRELGVTTIFGNPGSTELPFLKDFPDDFTYVLGLQEASVLGMAEGFAQATGNAALVNVHTAPGLGNAMGALVNAYHNKTPLLVTAGQQDRRHVSLEPLLTGRLVELAKPYVKRSHEPLRAEDLSEARNPAIVAGAGVDRSGAFYEVAHLAEKLRAPAWQDPISPLAGFPEDHPLFRGHLAPAQKQLADQLSGHDVVLVLGAPVFLYYPYVPGPVVERGTRVFQITEDPEEAARAVVGSSVIGDVRAAILTLTELLPKTDRPMPTAPEEPPVPDAADPM